MHRQRFTLLPKRQDGEERRIFPELPCAAVFSYEYDAVRRLLFYLKRRPDPMVFRYAAMRLTKALALLDAGTEGRTLYVNVPRSFAGKQKYGFDQGERLARAAGKMMGNAVFTPCLARRRSGKPQKMLGAGERTENQRGRFYVRPFCARSAGEPAAIVLIDDVITTGASMLACAAVLRRYYPNARFYGAALAHTLPETLTVTAGVPERQW